MKTKSFESIVVLVLKGKLTWLKLQSRDYLSLVNQGGSGFNISELVTAMVASEIEPKKALHTDKKTKSDERYFRNWSLKFAILFDTNCFRCSAK